MQDVGGRIKVSDFMRLLQVSKLDAAEAGRPCELQYRRAVATHAVAFLHLVCLANALLKTDPLWNKELERMGVEADL